MGDPDLPVLIGVDELARISGLARQTLYNKVNRQRRGEDVGRFPAPVTLGRRLRFRRADVVQWLAKGDVAAHEDDSAASASGEGCA